MTTAVRQIPLLDSQLSTPAAPRSIAARRHLAHADMLRRSGSGDQAALEYEAALDLDPTNPGALIALAELLMQGGDMARPQLLLLRCCGIAPDLAVAWALLGIASRGTNDAAAAETAFAQAQRIEPCNYDHALNRAAAAHAAGRADQELARLNRASAANPLDPVLLTAQGTLLERLGRLDDAVDVLEAAVMLAPDASTPLLELANALMRGPRGEAAEAALSRAIALLPDERLLRCNRAVVLMRLHRTREAVEVLRADLAANGSSTTTLCNLSTALTALGEQDEAVAAARQASILAPDTHLPWRSLMNAMAYQDGVTGPAMLAAARHAAGTIARSDFGRLANTPDPDRRIRVGLLSHFLKSHPVGWLTIAGLENLDPAAFELACIGQTPTGDPIERRFRAIASSWHDANILQREGLASGLRALGIDVLIDMGGYGDHGMMSVCAHRVAPVQIKWVGSQNHSSGLPEMDWFVTDRWETPPELAGCYSERLLHLPDGYAVYSPPPYAPDVTALPASRRTGITFGCFNNIAKMTPRVIRCWAEILHRIPQARLVLKTHTMDDAETQARVRHAFIACDLDPARLELRGRSPHRVLLQQYGDIDIVLDPFPYVGGLTTCEALWMGVPTITLAGETFSSRHAASHLSNIGLADWVATDMDAYCDMAVARANDIPSLVVLRSGMRSRVSASPLCDGPRFGNNLGAALRMAWQDWCARQT